MSSTPEPSVSVADQVPADLQRLVAALNSLPDEYAAQLAPMVDAVVESTKRRRRILTLVQDAISQLRLDMKYLMFDLEATRRERDEYRLKLDEHES
ncbi:MAG: transcriptional regulator [Planctomycetales bacterium]|nr:transcriptional regulator [Planctomycetales bacterium]